jgi:hypothetical protein
MAKLPKAEVSQTDLAYLTDRVLLVEGKKQIYGTQFNFSDGKWEPRPLEDPTSVDKRRAEVGLQPLAEYRRIWSPYMAALPKSERHAEPSTAAKAGRVCPQPAPDGIESFSNS